MTDTEARVVDLELRHMKLERELQELSSVVAAQQRSIDALTADARRRREHERGALQDSAPRDPRDEIPPHY
jgi:SlyX protein